MTAKTKIFSPNQVAAGSFLGAPGAAVFLLWKNFNSLGNSSGAKRTLVWGCALIALLFVILPVLPSSFPNYAIPIAYIVAARWVAEKQQMSKQEILASEQYELQSNWNVFGVSIGFLAAFCIVLFLWLFGLIHFGIFNPD
jgi:hypothetical protein